MLKLNNISKRLGQFNLSGINLEIPSGEYYVLLGRSGSGKTQLLELIAGLNKPDEGEIWLNSENITTRRIQDRKIGLVFQDYAIFPNMTVYGNIAYPLQSNHIDKKLISERVLSIASDLNIDQLLNRSTTNLSGGELQRVALARTLITSPELLLLDEPMSSIDASLKDDIKRVLRKLNKTGLTIIHVTHDYREAISLAHRVGVIHNGRLIQEGKPDDVFRKPVNKFVARYSGVRNFFRARFVKQNGSWNALCDNDIVLKIEEGIYPEEGLIILRSEDISIVNEKPRSETLNVLKGSIKEIIPCDYGMEITIDAGELFYADLTVEKFKQYKLDESNDVWISFPPEALISIHGTN